MKKPGMILKVLTVVSSVLLVAGFIGYRAGAFDWILGNETAGETERFMSSSKVKTLFFGLGDGKPSDVPSATYPQSDLSFMSSSKSIILASPEKTKPAK
jgi:hypothetical protein